MSGHLHGPWFLSCDSLGPGRGQQRLSGVVTALRVTPHFPSIHTVISPVPSPCTALHSLCRTTGTQIHLLFPSLFTPGCHNLSCASPLTPRFSFCPQSGFLKQVRSCACCASASADSVGLNFPSNLQLCCTELVLYICYLYLEYSCP